jgi:uncharacterized protein YbbK (DUF523 family)
MGGRGNRSGEPIGRGCGVFLERGRAQKSIPFGPRAREDVFMVNEPPLPPARPRIAVSACLLGRPTRYDGNHRLDRRIVEELGALFEWVPLCPEVELGLGVPREPMQLEGDPEAPRLMTITSRRDLTASILTYVERRVLELSKLDLCGFLLKRGSPSCGPAGVQVHAGGEDGGMGTGPDPTAAGFFAGCVRERFPNLPCMDEEMIADQQAARLFLDRAFTCYRSRQQDLQRRLS